MPFDGSKFTIASKMRALFGPDGEHWCRGLVVDNDRCPQVCLIGAYAVVTRFQSIEALSTRLGDKDWVRDEGEALISDEPAFRALATAAGAFGGDGPMESGYETVYINNDHASDFHTIRMILDAMEEVELQQMVSK